MPCTATITRHAQPSDWERVMAVMPQWWAGRDLRDLLPRVFFEHFRTTSFVVEHEERLLAFLVGFVCPTHPGEAYVHFAGVDPEWRRAGVARDLYRRFVDVAGEAGCTHVCAVTSVVNRDSIAFHRRLGFGLVPGDHEVEGLPAHGDANVPEGAVVKFRLDLGRTCTGCGRERHGVSRLTDAEALELLERGDLLAVGAAADEVRRALHPGDDVTFIVDRNINYTNVCLSGCRFCAFFVAPGADGGYLLDTGRRSTARSPRRSTSAARRS